MAKKDVGTRTFEVLNGMNIPAPPPAKRGEERRLEVGDVIEESDLVASKVDIEEALRHRDLAVKA